MCFLGPRYQLESHLGDHGQQGSKSQKSPGNPDGTTKSMMILLPTLLLSTNSLKAESTLQSVQLLINHAGYCPLVTIPTDVYAK